MLLRCHASARQALEKMNGKEVQGRFLKVDFDTKSAPKSSYKVNTETDRNRLYNRETIKNERSKRIKKDNEKKKLEKMRGYKKALF